MYSRADFNTPEWNTLQTSVVCVIKYVSYADNNALQDIIEKISANKSLKEFADKSPSKFIEDLVNLDGYKSPLLEHADDSLKGIEYPMEQSIKESLSILKARHSELITIYKELIIQLANDVAKNITSVTNNEQTAINYIQKILDEPIRDELPGHKFEL